jgi:hypothetical protein
MGNSFMADSLFSRSNKKHKHRCTLIARLVKKPRCRGLAIRRDSIGGKSRTGVPESVVEPGWRWQAGRYPIQPWPGAGPETQAAGAAVHGLRGAAQDAQALLVEFVKNSAGAAAKAFFRLASLIQIDSHGVLPRAVMTEF